MKKYISFLCVICCISISYCQSPYWSKVTDLLENGMNQFPRGLLQVDSNIYLSAGGSCTATNNSGCFQLAKFDFSGTQYWAKFDTTFSTNQIDVLISTDSTLYTGIDYRSFSGEKDFAIIRYDKDGAEISRLSFYDSCAEDLARSLKMSDDAFFFDTYCERETDSTKNGFVYRVAKDLSRVERRYQLTHAYPAFSDMAVFPDGKMAVAYTNPYIGQTSSYVDCFDTTGQLLWTFTHPYVQTNGKKWCSITPTRDSGFFVTWALDTFFYIDPPGYWTSGNYTFVYKLNGNGELEWTKSAIGGYTAFTKSILNAVEADNGDLICVGSNENLRYNDAPQIFPIRLSLGYAMRLSPDGELLWERTYLDTTQGKPISISELRNAVELPDKSWVFSGQFIEEWTPTSSNFTGQDIWLLRVDSAGCLHPNCTDTLQITLQAPAIPTQKHEPAQFDLWPNPGGNTMYLTSRIDSQIKPQALLLSVFDINSKAVKQIVFESQIGVTVDMAQMPIGSYFVMARQMNGNLIFATKWVKASE
jgi:hypothetical protein